MDFYTSNTIRWCLNGEPLISIILCAGNVLENVVSFGTDFSQLFQHSAGLTLTAQKCIESQSCCMVPNG